MRRLTQWLFLGLLAMLAAPNLAAQPSVGPEHSVVQAAPFRPMPSTPVLPLPFSLVAFALVGATAPVAKTTKKNLTRTYLFNGESFGPGNDIEVPEGFPEIDGETGDPIHVPGSVAERNARASRRLNFATPPNTGGVNTGESGGGSTNTVSGKSSAELNGMTKAELMELAEEKGITVERSDGDGEPLKDDYVTALGKAK